jgi:hypothetical protein
VRSLSRKLPYLILIMIKGLFYMHLKEFKVPRLT